MNISGTKFYSNKYISELNETAVIQKSPDTKVIRTVRGKNNGNGSGGHDKLISNNERQFFINMFPENSEQLQKHMLFNQNGRLQTPNINKGQIVDGRI